MKSYFYSIILILFAAALITFFPWVVSSSDNFWEGSKVPQNSSVLGIQKVNRPPTDSGILPPKLSARAIFVKDLGTGEILYQKDAHERLPIASTTKIMTALVSDKFFKPNSILTVGNASKVEGSKVGLLVGENITFRSLLYGMLLNSGNDAAFAIAENYPGGIISFVAAMNKKAADLKLPETHFQNPAGFDDPNHFSSAFDLATLTTEALTYPELAKVFATKETQVLSIDKKYKHPLKNLNKLLSSLNGVLGVKTGSTPEAKENLVTLVDRRNHRILTVVLGSDDRFGETTKLVEWAYSNFSWPN